MRVKVLLVLDLAGTVEPSTGPDPKVRPQWLVKCQRAVKSSKGQKVSHPRDVAGELMLVGLLRFPCAADKRPLTPHGFYDARANVDDNNWPLVGVPTGEVNGVDVVDIDPQGMSWYDLNFDALPATRAHST